jgi:hypothetical protein
MSWIEDKRTSLVSVVGDWYTYTYLVKDPWSDRERYMRAAPMDLYSPSQNHLTPREEAMKGRT